MKILGFIMVYPLLLMTLGTTTVLSTESQTFVQENNILEENTSYKKENPKEENEESPLSLTGNDTLDLLRSLNKILETLEKTISEREIISLHKTLGKVNYEETRQLFLNNVLMESLADGTPLYYNSNILGRYMKKDYYDKLT